MAVVLALDLATKTGFAVQRENGTIQSGMVTLPPASKTRTGERLNRFRKWLTETKNKHDNIDFVVWEQPVVRHAKAVAPLFQLVGTVCSWADHHGIGYANDGVASATIKKFATGCGHAKKKEMIQAARQLGFNITDDNEADALHLLRLTIENNPHLRSHPHQHCDNWVHISNPVNKIMEDIGRDRLRAS